MAEPQDSCSLQSFINKVRANGDVPLGLLYFDMEAQEVRLALAEGVTREEAQALLDKEGIYFKVTE